MIECLLSAVYQFRFTKEVILCFEVLLVVICFADLHIVLQGSGTNVRLYFRFRLFLFMFGDILFLIAELNFIYR